MIRDSLRESFRNMLRRPLQSSLAVLGIAVGIAGGITLASVGLGVERSVQEQVDLIGPGILSVIPAPASEPGQKTATLTIEDAKAISKEDLQGGELTPVMQLTDTVSSHKEEAVTTIVGIDSNFAEMRNLNLLEGRFFRPIERQQAQETAVLGESLAERLFPDGSAVGQTIIIRSVPYEVVGVSRFDGAGGTADVNDVVFLPYTTVSANLTGNEELGALLIKVPDPSLVAEAEQRVLNVLHRVQHWSLPPGAFQVNRQDQIITAARDMNSLIQLFVRGAIGIAFLLGGIGVMNVMLMAAIERQKEIGIYLAFGARPRLVQVQFLLESVWIMSIGIFGGLLLGTFAGVALHAVAGLPWALKPGLYVSTIAGGLLLGLLFGVYPSLRAARVNPAEVIRKP
jgi:putative ABC transport system permease protein